MAEILHFEILRKHGQTRTNTHTNTQTNRHGHYNTSPSPYGGRGKYRTWIDVRVRSDYTFIRRPDNIQGMGGVTSARWGLYPTWGISNKGISTREYLFIILIYILY